MFLFKQKTAYELRISDWSSDVCSSDLVGRSDHPDAAVRFGQVLPVHQPVDGVPRIGDVIDLGRVERADRRPVDDIVALRPIFAADILINADIAVLHENLVGKRSEEHTSELQSLMRISYAVFCLKKKSHKNKYTE